MCVCCHPVCPHSLTVFMTLNSGGVHGSSVRCKVNIIRNIYFNKISFQPRKVSREAEEGEKKTPQFFIEISIQPECNPHHRQSNAETAERKKSHPLFIAKKKQPITYMLLRYKKKKKYREAKEEGEEEDGGDVPLSNTGPDRT